jgi:hypothetical protein
MTVIFGFYFQAGPRNDGDFRFFYNFGLFTK